MTLHPIPLKSSLFLKSVYHVFLAELKTLFDLVIIFLDRNKVWYEISEFLSIDLQWMLEILVIADIIAYRTSDLQHVLFLCKYLANAVF